MELREGGVEGVVSEVTGIQYESIVTQLALIQDHTHQLVEAIQLATMVEVEEVSVLWWEGVTCVYHTL